MKSPRVQVVLNDEPVPPVLARALNRTGATFAVSQLAEGVSESPQTAPDVVVVVASSGQHVAGPRLERLLAALADRACAILIIADAPLDGLSGLDRPSELPLLFAIAPTEEELTARLATMYEYCGPLRQILQRADRLKQQGQKLTDRANHRHEQLLLASQVQRDFLPQVVPQCEGVRFATLYRPADYVSGDIYDIARLDETHIGITVADVTGHGVPAALLTLFIKHAVRAKQIEGNHYRILSPDEVLTRLNHDVLSADLQQCQFVTICQVVYDHQHRVISWARGGSPYPILVRRGQPARQVLTAGDLIGVFDRPQFEVRTEGLEPGDAMLFLTDGVEALLLMGDPRDRRDHLSRTDWFAGLGSGPIDEHIARIDQYLDRANDHRWPRDDVTIVALSVDG